MFGFKKYSAQLVLPLALLLFLCRCVSAPLGENLTERERHKRDRLFGMQLSAQFETSLHIFSDVDLGVYLRSLAARLANAHLLLREEPVGVFVVRDQGGLWKNFSLPGNRIYLSVGLLKQAEYENEVVAHMALQLAYLQHRHVLNRLEQLLQSGWIHFASNESTLELTRTDFLGVAGLFFLSEEQVLLSIETAVGLMYQAGVDPRGLTRIWQAYRENLMHSPFERDALDRFLEKTRSVIALSAPLRNPLVKSESFIEARKRIQKL